MAYDSRRERLLLSSDLGKNQGDVLEYDFKTGARFLTSSVKGSPV